MERVEGSRSGCFDLWTGIVFELDHRRQNKAADREFTHVTMRSSRGRDWMRGGREFVHCRRLKSTRVSLSSASSCDRDEHVPMVRNVSLSQYDDRSPATMTTPER